MVLTYESLKRREIHLSLYFENETRVPAGACNKKAIKFCLSLFEHRIELSIFKKKEKNKNTKAIN